MTGAPLSFGPLSSSGGINDEQVDPSQFAPANHTHAPQAAAHNHLITELHRVPVLSGIFDSFATVDGPLYVGFSTMTNRRSSTAGYKGSLYFPFAGTITKAHLQMASSTAGASVSITADLHVHEYSSGALVNAVTIATVTQDAVWRIFSNMSLSVGVTGTQWCEIVFNKVAGGTAPTNVYVHGYLELQRSYQV